MRGFLGWIRRMAALYGPSILLGMLAGFSYGFMLRQRAAPEEGQPVRGYCNETRTGQIQVRLPVQTKAQAQVQMHVQGQGFDRPTVHHYCLARQWDAAWDNCHESVSDVITELCAGAVAEEMGRFRGLRRKAACWDCHVLHEMHHRKKWYIQMTQMWVRVKVVSVDGGEEPARPCDLECPERKNDYLSNYVSVYGV